MITSDKEILTSVRGATIEFDTQTYNTKGRTIRKVMGREGNFQLARTFFHLRLVQESFSGETLCKIFFFRQILVFKKVIDRPTQTFLCGFTVVARKPPKFCSGEYSPLQKREGTGASFLYRLD